MVKRVGIVDSDLCVGCQCCVLACSRRKGEIGLGKSAILVRSVGGMERGHVIIVCRACKDPPCAIVCPEEALRPRRGGGIIFNPEKCIGCGHCVEACPFGAINWDEKSLKPIVCTYCGYCTEYCPYGVLRLEEVRS